MVKDYIEFVIHAMQMRKIEEDAPQMKRYMKNHFEFYGVKSPIRKSIFKEATTLFPFKEKSTLISIVNGLWDLPQRELQYLALDLLERRKKHLGFEDLLWVEQLICTKSWWDTVDGLAPNVAGYLFDKYRTYLSEYVLKWRESDHLWLMRSSLICQLRFKDRVDEQLLFETIDYLRGSGEFFINKAAGWSLRQYSKFYPERVRHFLAERELPKLVVREASKYI